MRKIYTVLFALCTIIMMNVSAQAQDVTLTSRDGKVSIQGTLLTFDGEFYRIKSIYGDLTFERSAVVCAGSGCPDLETYVAEFTLSGAKSIGEILLPALVEDFAAQSGMTVRRNLQDDVNFNYEIRQPDTGKTVARIIFQISTTDDGFARFLAGETDMVLASREITALEQKAARKAGLGDLKSKGRSKIVALDGLVPVVAHSNPAGAISLSDLAQVFAGKINNWQQIQGADAPIYLHLAAVSSGMMQQFEQSVIVGNGLTTATTIVRHATSAQLVDAVAADPFAIGITRLSEVGNTKKLAIKGNCGMEFQATTRSLKTEDYPLSAPLFIYTPARRLPKTAREFLTYLRSPAAQRVVRAVGFVDQKVSEIAISEQGKRFANAITAAGQETELADLQNMISTLRPAKRLTITFRFEAGSSKLDAQSRSNVVHLARLLEAGMYDGRDMLFVGFSDGKGDAKINQRIANRRASAVHSAVTKAASTLKPDQLSLQIKAFGEAMPMACDDTEWGRQVNRRVEVWVK